MPHLARRSLLCALDPGLRVIVTYKLVRGGLALLAALALAVCTASGHTEWLEHVVALLRHHVTRAWSVDAVELLSRAIEPVHLWMAVGVLAVDGSLTWVEGWSVLRGYRWGPWLIVVLALFFVPFEVAALVRRADVVRVLALSVNVAVVAYLVRRAAQHRGRHLRRAVAREA